MNEKHPAYLKALTFPRFVLAMLVVIFHFGLHLPLFSESYFSEVFKHGAVAVSFFFFLSGLVLAYNYDNRTSPREFLLKRLFRIYPIYLASFLAVLISFYLINKDLTDLFRVFMNALGLQAWMPGYALEINFPAWSISVEFFLYSTFPLLLYFFSKIQWKRFATVSICVIILGWIEHYCAVNYLYEPDRFFVGQFILYFPLFHFTTFLAGFLCGKWIVRMKEKRFQNFLFSALSLLGIVLFILILNFDNPLRIYAHNGGLIPVFALICCGLALDRKIFTPLFGSPYLIYLGNISYGIYMWQFPVFIWYSQWTGESQLSGLNFLFYILILTLWGSLSFEFIEKPIRRKLSRNFLAV
ncbi:MAG: acyltransferase [Brumimicrobium sp.]|nr:acyltransferase [Brumimicrobium sp.]